MKFETKFIHKGDDTNHKKLLSCSIFRMKDKYRNFYIYNNSLLELIRYCKTHLNDWTLRIYLDDSISDSYKKNFFFDNTEVVKYRCEDFWDSDTQTHEGVFGMFIRYLPFFSAKKHERIGVLDVEPSLYILNAFNKIKSIDGFVYTEVLPTSWASNKNGYRLLGQSFVSTINFPRRILSDFLTRVKEGSITLKKTKDSDKYTILPYGSDEYFLNTTFMNYLDRHSIRYKALRVFYLPPEVYRLIEGMNTKPIEKEIKQIKEIDKLMYYKPETKLPNDILVKPLKKVIAFLGATVKDNIALDSLKRYIQNPKFVEFVEY